MSLSKRSLSNLEGVHPDLVRVVKRAHEIEPFIVTQGLRSLSQQKENIAKGVSWTLASRHLTGHAVDVCDPDGCYDLPDMIRIGKAFKQAAAEFQIPVIWGAQKKYGGDWTKRNDTPHFELDARAYPSKPFIPATDKIIVAASKPPAVAATGVAVGAGVVESGAALPVLPSPPDLSVVSAWQTFGNTLGDIAGWVTGHPILTAFCAAWAAVAWYSPTILRRLGWQQS